MGVKTTGHEKDRFTVARADGSKIHPMVILNSKRKDKTNTLDKIAGVIVQIQGNAWMTEELTLRWLTIIR